MGSISIRRSIQWLPDDPAPVEPTSTVVLTSPGRRFVDIRILLPKGSESVDSAGRPGGKESEMAAAHRDFGTITYSSLDWAFAGTSESQPVPARPDGKGPTTHSKWHHLVTDRAAVITPGQFTDEGDMYPQPDGSVLEKGRMTNPMTGRETDYEEVWVDGEPGVIPASSSPGGTSGDDKGRASRTTCVVLEARDGQDEETVVGMVVCLGKFCQGVVRRGKRFGLERWSFNDENGDGEWQRRAEMLSGLWTPAGEVVQDPSRYSVGDVTKGADDGYSWVVVEAS
ncbi:uncharacterized protein B0I36DRAFT_381109 [Microdochium trichocladiopsis]|uniref:Protein HRI1 n=1 Tax=Microdochium trichocladiopsis TaxID=1682393 RepID=A0A9P8YH38_9PEZI|nr:uncharacterized protein B0I36DRAFT_381109 [Microdochium trichocladiopsis]KAH7038025.1 hypothetical protein B0I36DRAFT_381109 [Microdochium trichocladiopsis]